MYANGLEKNVAVGRPLRAKHAEAQVNFSLPFLC